MAPTSVPAPAIDPDGAPVRDDGSVIVVVGEALIDLVVSSDASVHAAPGGAPFNSARAAARLGAPVRFVGGISTDAFGRRLAAQLADDGVDVSCAVRTELPTTLAAAELDPSGAADYRFYVEATSAPAVGLDAVRRALAPDEASGAHPDLLLTGGLALVLAPLRDSVLAALDRLDERTLVVVDVNCRPAVVDDRDAYVARVERALRRADLVKVSDEDLAYLRPGLAPVEAAVDLLGLGARVVVVTAGAAGTTVVGPGGEERVVDVPPPPGPVVDTIGAGDTFGAGVVAWWSASGLGRADVEVATVVRAVRAGHAAAGVVVTRRGADPPTLHDLAIPWP